ncbi:MAG: PEP-utilizing enzyme [Methylococcales bacterium]
MTARRLKLFRCSIKTVSTEVTSAINAVRQGRLHPAQFFTRYGHLRPGSYNIRSLRYADRNDLFSGSPPSQETTEAIDFVLTLSERHHINQLLKQATLDSINADSLIKYMSQAIAARELSKFVFSRFLSGALEAIATWGITHDFDREALSYLTLDDLMACLDNGCDNPAGIQQARETISHYRHIFQLQKQVKIGQIITKIEDLDVIRMEQGKVNFIGNGRVEAKTVALTPKQQTTQNLSKMIVCIENADPGFDWIFTQQIAGLVTCFGGPNSHMAIRCHEFGLPAALGCGEMLYLQIQQSENVILDCENQTLRPWRVFG